ncbi:putative manganese transporter [Nocardioides sp. zg-DK7169]|uniref:putative manganese transporter n=1 Tax=Nocardioides sp. zg-DK7169 TaxID=2736600 RepID=UPI0015550A31|nr:putative manganese transporter [Nocardioides sp. zg-DK7169]NPC96824.1 arsenic efflux protein [Nocardioides sp. zg-DK7169]
MTDLVLRPLADAFMQVGVFVALLVAPVGWAHYRWGGRLDELVVRYRRLAPLVAALLTMPPGCGGAILVVAAYARGAVSYGAVVAALVATMGDATWVLLAAEPLLTLQLKALLLITGAASGYLVDALGIAPARRERPRPAAVVAQPRPARPAVQVGPEAGVTVRAALLSREPATALHALGVLPLLLWVTLGAGATISIPVTFQVITPSGTYLVLGLAGTFVAVLAFVRGGCRLADDDLGDARPTSMAHVLRHGGHEVAFVTVWVAAAYLAWSVLSHATGFDGTQLPVLGLVGVAVGALVGLIPGCAIQIVFTGIFLAGGMPLPTLVANMVSQDGDALLPLAALEHRAALLATVLTTLPALVVGGGLFLLL